MPVKNAGTLSKDYFISYLKLQMNTQKLTIDQAIDQTFKHFFNSNKDRYGESTYQSFLQACRTMEKI
ncbi:hypothetical protein [Virgibacillus ainsalahensis]